MLPRPRTRARRRHGTGIGRTTLAAYRRTWIKLLTWTPTESFDLASLPREKALAYFEDLTGNGSASHHLEVKPGISFLYKVLDQKSPFLDCLAPWFRPEALEIQFLEAGDIGKVLLHMRHELSGDYFGRLCWKIGFASGGSALF